MNDPSGCGPRYAVSFIRQIYFLRWNGMILVKSQRNMSLWIRFQIASMKLRFWWKHLRHLTISLCTKHWTGKEIPTPYSSSRVFIKLSPTKSLLLL